jgi:hypothetical protein
MDEDGDLIGLMLSVGSRLPVLRGGKCRTSLKMRFRILDEALRLRGT